MGDLRLDMLLCIVRWCDDALKAGMSAATRLWSSYTNQLSSGTTAAAPETARRVLLRSLHRSPADATGPPDGCSSVVVLGTAIWFFLRKHSSGLLPSQWREAQDVQSV